MKRIMAVLLAVLMMLFTTGCYRNTAQGGAGAHYRGRTYDGLARSRSYDGYYSGHYGGYYSDGRVHGGMFGDGARMYDRTQQGGGSANQRGGTAQQGGGSASQRGGTAQQGGGSASQRGGTTQQGGGSHQRNTMLRDGARRRAHQNTPSAMSGLEYVR